MAKAKAIDRTYTVIKSDPVRVKPDYRTKKLKTLAVGAKVRATKLKGHYIYVPALKGWTIWKDSKGVKYVRLVSNNARKTKADKLVAELASVERQLLASNAKYNANHAAKSLASAKKTKKTNCATFISYGLQGIGVLPNGKYIWLDTKIHGNGASIIKKKAHVSYPRKSWKRAGLKKGDVCGFANKPHTMVYCGKNKAGKPLWYSCGGSDVSAKNLGPKRKSRYEERKVQVRIRLK